MFVTIRHGDDAHHLFNPDCALRLLVEDIKKRCHCPAGLTVALLDDKWAVIQLPELSLDNASSRFTDRGVYILVGIEKRDSGHPKYTSLLDNPDEELRAKLEALSHQGTQPTSRKLTKKPSKTALLTTSKSKKSNSSLSRSKGK